MQNTIEIKLDTYNKISDKNFRNYEELFFSEIFFKTLKQTSEYETNDSMHFLLIAEITSYPKLIWGKTLGN